MTKREQPDNYAIVDAAGRYGDFTKVYRSFQTLAEADAYASRRGYAVLSAELSVGDRVHRIDAARYAQRADAERASEESGP